jgi:hypothetical protein
MIGFVELQIIQDLKHGFFMLVAKFLVVGQLGTHFSKHAPVSNLSVILKRPY